MDSTVRARVDSDLKQEAEAIFKKLGLSTSQAIVMFLNMVKLNNGVPFEVKIPNKDTLKAMQEAKEFKGEEITLKDLNEGVKTIQIAIDVAKDLHGKLIDEVKSKK